MANIRFRLIDNNTGEEVSASDDFAFATVPAVQHHINDPELIERYGGPAVVQKVVETGGGYDIYIDGTEQHLNTGDADGD